MYARDEAQQSVVEHLCRNLSQLRRAHALTQGQLGEAAGITRNHYQLLERGRTASGDIANPRLSTLIALGQVLHVEANVLLLPPTPFTAWFWIEVEADVTEDQVESLFQRLVGASEAHLGKEAGAFIGHEDQVLTLGVGVVAPSRQIAEVIAHHEVATAITSVGLSGTFAEHREVEPGLADLVRSSDT